MPIIRLGHRLQDLEIPWHKIGYEEIDLREHKGYNKHKVEDWQTYRDENANRCIKTESQKA